MKFTRGNLALRDHLKNGKRVFLFEYIQRGIVKFVNELIIEDFDFFPTLDTSGFERRGIKFFFKKVGVHIPYDLKLANQIFTEDLAHDIPLVTEREGLVLSRVGQGAYRKSIINRWENKCAVTGFSDSRILIASHILPWKDANNDERLDINNGILLSPTFDALFDRHLISFGKNGKILLSDSIAPEAYNLIGVKGNEKIRKELTYDNISYLVKHNERFYGINKVVN